MKVPNRDRSLFGTLQCGPKERLPTETFDHTRCQTPAKGSCSSSIIKFQLRNGNCILILLRQFIKFKWTSSSYKTGKSVFGETCSAFDSVCFLESFISSKRQTWYNRWIEESPFHWKATSYSSQFRFSLAALGIGFASAARAAQEVNEHDLQILEFCSAYQK